MKKLIVVVGLLFISVAIMAQECKQHFLVVDKNGKELVGKEPVIGSREMSDFDAYMIEISYLLLEVKKSLNADLMESLHDYAKAMEHAFPAAVRGDGGARLAVDKVSKLLKDKERRINDAKKTRDKGYENFVRKEQNAYEDAFYKIYSEYHGR